MPNDFGTSVSQKYYEFELDSLDADSPSDASYTQVNWPLFKIGGKRPLANIAAIKILEVRVNEINERVKLVKLILVQIPFTFYVIETYNNSFFLLETGHPIQNVTLPIGNYTISQIELALAAALTAASLSLFTYAVTYDSVTQKITVWNNSVANAPFSLIFGAVPEKTPAQALGFVKEFNTSVLYTAVLIGVNKGNYLVSPNAIMITGANYLYVNSRRIGSLTDLYLPRGAVQLGNGNAGPQMAKIPVSTQPGSIMYWQDPDHTKWFDMENLPTLSEVDFYLTLGNTSQVLDLKGQPFSLKLGIIENTMQRITRSSGPSSEDHVVKRMRTV